MRIALERPCSSNARELLGNLPAVDVFMSATDLLRMESAEELVPQQVGIKCAEIKTVRVKRCRIKLKNQQILTKGSGVSALGGAIAHPGRIV